MTDWKCGEQLNSFGTNINRQRLQCTANCLFFQGNNRDFYAALQFLSGSGPMMAMVERLMAGISGTAAGNDPSHFLFNEYPATQLPVARQSNVFLSPFEFYFYHFANAPVRRHQLFNSGGGLGHGSPAGDGGSVSDMLYPLLVEVSVFFILPFIFVSSHA